MWAISSRYIFKQLLIGMVLVTIGLLSILWLTQSLRFVELIVNQGISSWTFLTISLLFIPNFLPHILPISLFSIILFTYNRLTMDRELVVMRAAGMSQWGLAKPALLLALAATIFGYGLNIWIIPKSAQEFRELQWTIRNNISGLLLQEGAFTQVQQGLTVYVRERSPDGALHGILVHDSREPGTEVTLTAERGALMQGDSGPRVMMLNGARQERRQDDLNLSVLYFDSYTIDFGGPQPGLEARSRDDRELSIRELHAASPEDYSPTGFRRLKVELHQRLVTPLNHLTFAMIALATLLSGSFNRRGQAPRVLTAVGLMVMVQAAALGTGNLAANDLRFVPLMYVTALLPLPIAAWVLLRPPRRPRTVLSASS
ncbi:LPS export ABC transporter permease LptF [Telmatospirillum sp. J64-1]|uniref:LPS export ABC transporter permease LptF n=1 Tax=Telmatospirillum sp. J64-1 TaxID=2502183 RepID=UPI002106677E|nr:LPS export ABC transporter permease LptF [Telmatospirillum sp. J64-1]